MKEKTKDEKFEEYLERECEVIRQARNCLPVSEADIQKIIVKIEKEIKKI